MAINYATKYSQKVDERFTLKSISKAFTNMDYEWNGVDTIKVYSIPTVAMTDYTLSGIARYGTPADLQNEVQTMLLTKDRSFSIVIDSKSNDDTQGVMSAGKALARQLDEVITPEIDTYVFAKMGAAAVANSNTATAAVTKTNAYEVFLDGQISLGNDLVPTEGRLAACSYSFYKFIKLDTSFMLASEIAMGKRVNGMVGEVDGVKLVLAPSTYLPTNCAFILAHPRATVQANKLQSFVTHKNAPGINGDLIEGRVRYDAFVLNSKKNAIYMHLVA